MTTPQQATGISTWDAQPPYRPGTPDLNGAALTDRADAMPNPGTMPTAALINGIGLCELSIGQVVPNAVLSVKYVSSAPVLDSGTAAAGVSNGNPNPIAAGAITIIRTPGGAGSGDVLVLFPTAPAPTTLFPSPVTRPWCTLNGATPAMAPAADRYTVTETAWSAGEGVTTSTYNVPATANGYFYECSTAGSGTTGATASAWPTTVGAFTAADANGVIWKCIGPVNGIRVVTVDHSNSAADLPFTLGIM